MKVLILISMFILSSVASAQMSIPTFSDCIAYERTQNAQAKIIVQSAYYQDLMTNFQTAFQMECRKEYKVNCRETSREVAIESYCLNAGTSSPNVYTLELVFSRLIADSDIYKLISMNFKEKKIR